MVVNIKTQVKYRNFEEKMQSLLETYYFRIPKQIKGINKEMPDLLGTSPNKLFYENKGVRIYQYPANLTNSKSKKK